VVAKSECPGLDFETGAADEAGSKTASASRKRPHLLQFNLGAIPNHPEQPAAQQLSRQI